jgi:predicted DCC family thiol-disulfide oxidoreductase YuxK
VSIEKIVVIYDKACPACDNYCQWVRINESLGLKGRRELLLIDARENPEYLALVTQRGLDIDQGMVVLVNETLYYGSDAIHVLALMSSQVGIFNRINYWLFKSKVRAHFLYPVLRTLRGLLLKILGKTKINNLQHTNNTHF